MCLNPSVRAVLKNANNTLPLDVKSFHSLAVLGPFANSTTELMGGYSGPNLRILTHSPRDALQRRMTAVSPATQMLSATGCINGANRTNQIELAVHTAQQADATVLFVGDTHVAEFSDRTWNGLEYAQEQLVDAVCNTGKPVVVVVVAGHSIDLTVAKRACGAILFAFLPSQFGGDAIADVLLGQYSPAGRLPITFYDSSVNVRSNFNPVNMALRHGNGVTYQHFRGTPLYEFGKWVLDHGTWVWPKLRSRTA
jgi:beta-glucosidase|eukprot:COSAG01_NODE_2305_length_7947_cov_76.250127_5_plen_253_part_00